MLKNVWACRAWTAEAKRAKAVYDRLSRTPRGGDTTERFEKRAAAGTMWDLARSKADEYCESRDGESR